MVFVFDRVLEELGGRFVGAFVVEERYFVLVSNRENDRRVNEDREVINLKSVYLEEH